jgi:2,4-dienoyl-CoA reductase-like NADH-dependent reductase (Old Yellow Enzyme family)/NADPH-dependent 2,4-dienoyl-CoA reductase/sulfur reductase-like enzyme
MPFPKLFEPGKIGRLELKNRIIMAPMITLYVNQDGSVSDRMLDYYGERARGGCAMVIIEASYPRSGGYPGRIFVGSDQCLDGLRKLVEVIHEGGAKACIEVNTHRGMDDEVDPASASEMVHPIKGIRVRALGAAELKELQKAFGEAARRAKEAGFDCLMIHGGYIISEFQSPLLNKRTDQYGGDVSNRARLGLEFLAVAREGVGPDYPIIFRLPCQRKDISDRSRIIFKLPYDEAIEEGFRVEETVAVSKLLERGGVDAVGVTSAAAGNYRDIYGAPNMQMPRGLNASTSKAVKKEVTVPVFVNGGINNPHLAEDILMEGKADFIELGRPLVADPQFPSKAMTGDTEDIRTCILCSRCVESIFRPPVGPMACSVNPAVGKEKEFELGLKPSAQKKKVLVIGAGPAGMEASLVAAARGHEVTLWEKDDKLGGQLNLAIIPPGKDELSSLIRYLRVQLDKSGVKVVLNMFATPEAILKYAPDVIVVAVGSRPSVPNIKGLEKRKALQFEDVLLGKAEVGKSVIVVGGGFVGCETAEFLSEKGKKVTIVEILPQLASELFFPYAYQTVQRLKERKVEIYTGVKAEEITDRGMEIIDEQGNRISLDADDIIIATGSVAEKSLSKALEGKGLRLYEVGDCHRPARIYEAISEGAEAGLRV